MLVLILLTFFTCKEGMFALRLLTSSTCEEYVIYIVSLVLDI